MVVLTPAVSSGASPGLTVTGFSPGAGPVGTTVIVSGSGFVSGDLVAFNGRQAKVSGVNTLGTRLTTSVPAFATSGVLTVTDPATGQTAGLPNQPFTVTLGVYATPNRVWAGGRFTLDGSAFPPYGSGSVRIGNVTVAAARFDQNGDFSIGVTVPWSQTSGITHVQVVYSLGTVLATLYILGAWPMYRHDPQHTGDDTYETSISVSNVPALKLLWMKTTAASCQWVLPSVADGLVFESNWNPATQPESSNFYAFTTNGKKMLWLTGSYETLRTEPAVTAGKEYLSASNGISTIDTALSATTGAFDWSKGLPDISSYSPSAPNVVGNTLYLGAPDGNLYAVNAATGTVLWSFQTGAAVHSSPAYAAGIVYVGSDSGTFYAVNATTGKKVWSYSGLGAIDSSPAVAGGVVYVGSDNGSVIAFKAGTGAVVWHDIFSGQDFPASPTVANGTVFIGGSTASAGYLYARKASDGSKLWTFPTVTPGVSDAAYANGLVYFASGNVVRAADASNGNILWKNTSVTAPLAPIIANGIVYLEGQNNIWAYGP